MKYCIIFSLLFFFLFHEPIYSQAGMTPEEIEFMNYFEEAQKDFETTFSTMSPDEQRKIIEMQQALEQRFEQLDEQQLEEEFKFILTASDEELQKYIADVLPNTPSNLKSEEPKPVELVKEPDVEEKPISKEELLKYDKVNEMLDFIVKKIELFLVKVYSIPDIEVRVAGWVQNQKKGIIGWPDNLSWNRFSIDIEGFSRQLILLQDRDPKTKSFKYLDGLLERQDVIEKLTSILQLLKVADPQLIEASFGVNKLTPETKNAIKGAINGLLNILYGTTISADLSAIIAKFDPEAEKRRKEEQDARLLAEGATPPAPGVTVVAPSPIAAPFPAYGQPMWGGQPAYYGSPYGGGYGATPLYPQAPGASPAMAPSLPATPTLPTTPPTTPVTTPQPAKKEEASQKSPVDLKNSDVERMVGRIDSELNEIKTYIANNSEFTNLRSNLTDASKQLLNTDEFIVLKVPYLNKRLETTMSDISALARKVRVLGPEGQKYYINEFKTMTNEYVPSIKTLATDIHAVGSYWYDIQRDKRIAYFKSVDLPNPLKISMPKDTGIETPAAIMSGAGEAELTQLQVEAEKRVLDLNTEMTRIQSALNIVNADVLLKEKILNTEKEKGETADATRLKETESALILAKGEQTRLQQELATTDARIKDATAEIERLKLAKAEAERSNAESQKQPKVLTGLPGNVPSGPIATDVPLFVLMNGIDKLSKIIDRFPKE